MRQIAAIAALWGCAAMGQAAVGVSVIEGEFADDVAFLSADAGVDPPLFSFASPSPFRGGYSAYQGLPATDGCHAASSVTGTKGEALTFTRATTRFCPTSANEATGVMCASGEVCITSGGTTRGISIFRAGTNVTLRSEELDNAAWSKEVGVSVSANDAACPVAPGGTQTMDLVTFAGGVDGRGIFNVATLAAGATTRSLWVVRKTGGAACVLSLKDSNEGADATVVTVTTSLQRVSLSRTQVGTLGGHYLREATVGDCTDACVWGGQYEQSTYATPYVATTSASATRNAELVTLPIAWDGGNLISAAFTSVTRGASGLIASQGGLALNSSFPSGGPAFLSYYTGGAVWRTFTTASDRASVVPADTAPVRVANGCDGTNSFSIWGGASTTNGTNCDAIANTSDVVALGWFTTNTQLDGIISNVCIDASPTRCR